MISIENNGREILDFYGIQKSRKYQFYFDYEVSYEALFKESLPKRSPKCTIIMETSTVYEKVLTSADPPFTSERSQSKAIYIHTCIYIEIFLKKILLFNETQIRFAATLQS